LSAQAANQILGGVVRNTGSLQADGISDKGGVIRLSASRSISHNGSISADAAPGSAGKGGEVTLIADLSNPKSSTEVSGSISARGGELGGDGGFVDTSASRLFITQSAAVSTAAPKGRAGTWLLDPYDIIISDTATLSGDPYSDSYVATSDTSVIRASSIVAALDAGTSVSISTGAPGSAGGQAGNIDVQSNIIKSTSTADTTLTLTAANQIQVDAGVTIGSTGSALHLDLHTSGSSGSRKFEGVFSGSGSLTKSGSGHLVMSGANTYTGGTTVSAGTLKAGSATAFGTGAISVTSGAALDLGGQTMTSTGALTLNGTGLSSGGALLNSSSTAATYAGLVTLGSSSSIVGGSGVINLTHTGTITGSGFGLTLGGAQGGTLWGILGTGAGALTKQDAGTWTFRKVSTYSGGTTVNGGTLNVGVDQLVNPFGSGTITVNSGATLKGYRTTMSNPLVISGGTLNDDNGFGGDYSGTVSLVGNLLIDGYFRLGMTGVISGSGGIIKGGSGELSLTGSNTYTGGTIINAGTLQIGTGGTTGSITGDVSNSGTLAFNRSNSYSFGGVISGSGAVTQAGSGNLTLTGANTYSGGTTISGGTLTAGHLNALGSTSGALTLNGGTLDLGSFNQTVGAVSIGASGGTLTASSGALNATSVTQVSSSTLNLGADISTSGAQSYGNLVLTHADVGLMSTAAGISIAGNVSLSSALNVQQIIQYLDNGAYRISSDGGANYTSGTLSGTATTINGGTLSFASNAYSYTPSYSGSVTYLIVAGGGGAGFNYVRRRRRRPAHRYCHSGIGHQLRHHRGCWRRGFIQRCRDIGRKLHRLWLNRHRRRHGYVRRQWRRWRLYGWLWWRRKRQCKWQSDAPTRTGRHSWTG
jgi:autotransporter-associated beta strand protein